MSVNSAISQPTAPGNIETSARIAFLNQIHLFNGLTEAQLAVLADELEELTFPAGQEIYKPGEMEGRLFLVWSGKVKIIWAGKTQPPATFVTGDHLGEESMLGDHHLRISSVIPVEKTQLLVLTRRQFQMLVKQAPTLKTNFTVSLNSYSLERRIHFKWLPPDEIVYFLARKHPILLFEALVGPVILALVSIFGMLMTWIVPVQSATASHLLEQLWYVALVGGLGALGWGVWNGFDWSNDYYVITDRRVVWVEKVIGIYESRQESPLSAVQRVVVGMDFSGRLMDYGDLVISTIVGSTLKLRNVDHPYQAAALIDQFWKRSRQSSRRMDAEEIQSALRSRLLDGPPNPPELKGVVTTPAEKLDPYQDQHSLVNLFRLRFENFATVTYRKHIFVLFEQTLIPGVVLLVLLMSLIYELLTPASSFATFFKADGGFLALLWGIIFIAAVFWWIYAYVDWSNDIFQVTPDQIMDIDKTPLGQISSDIASLDNILSIEYKRVGLLELLFNYGTVFITIGGGREMHFENVYNPSAVQEDIERRRLEKIIKKEQDTIKAERDRTADWFAAYFQNEEKLRQEDGAPGDENQSDSHPGNEVK